MSDGDGKGFSDDEDSEFVINFKGTDTVGTEAVEAGMFEAVKANGVEANLGWLPRIGDQERTRLVDARISVVSSINFRLS